MAPIRYSLHYEDYSEHLMSRFGKLLQMQSLVDMTLMCSSHTLRVHRAVLAASSAYFQEVLQKQTGEPLIILKMRFSVLKCLVEFMYCGKTQCLEENLDELVSAAQFLKIKGLSKVTKEGLGITNHSELPVFTPPVVINRPPQSLIDLHSQDTADKPPPPQISLATSAGQPVESLCRGGQDMVMRLPLDAEGGGGAPACADRPDAPTRSGKPRRGRPNARRGGGGVGWDGAPALGRAAERALLRREQDSRKAIHQLKSMQSRQMQDYMERVTLSQAVNSICGPESSSTHNYMNMDNDLMYMDQTISSNVLETISYSKEHSMTSETITSSYSTATTSSAGETANTGISTAMSQYVNALKSAGLPTDLPILFESGDGSYINVNEQVLLDMVQSSEIQYEVIEQPNIIEKVADPSEIKSIDDLSKSIERGEMLMGSKGYASTNSYDKDNQYNRDNQDTMNSLNAILPDNLEPFAEQQNFVVLDPRLQEGNNMDSVNANDFSCIDGDMQFFTKSMSDDVKKYYEEQQLNDARDMEQLCPTSTTLDTNFSISLLDTKSSHLSGNMSQQYNPLNPDELRRNDDCYDFGLQLPQSTDFKEDTLDCLISIPKRGDDTNQIDKRAQERDEIIQDLMNIENNIAQNNSNDDGDKNFDSNNQNFNDPLDVNAVFNNEANMQTEMHSEKTNNAEDLSATITSSGLQWEDIDINNKETGNTEAEMINNRNQADESQFQDDVIDLTEPKPIKTELTHLIDITDLSNKEKEQCDIRENDIENNIPYAVDFIPLKHVQSSEDGSNKENEQCDSGANDVENDIPYAVGLLPLKHVQPSEDESLLKRKKSFDNLLENVDAKCLKRKVKYKKL